MTFDVYRQTQDSVRVIGQVRADDLPSAIDKARTQWASGSMECIGVVHCGAPLPDWARRFAEIDPLRKGLAATAKAAEEIRGAAIDEVV